MRDSGERCATRINDLLTIESIMKENNLPTSPPKSALRVLSWFCPHHLYEEIEGDLIQKFNRDVSALSERRAKRRLIGNVIRFFRPGIILRNQFSFQLNQGDMFRSYFKIMLRNVMKRKFHSAVTVFGLTVGITFALLIGVFAWGEWQVNQQLADVDRLYILEQNSKNNSGMGFFAPVPLGKWLKNEYPQLVENYYRFYDRNIKVARGDKHFLIQGMVGDSTFLKMFGFPVLYGNAATALNQPYSIVITEKTALQFFNRSNVVGETLTLTSGTEDKKEYVITAVVGDLGRNSVSDLVNINAQIFVPLQNANDFLLPDTDDWQSGEMITYLKLMPGASPAQAESIIAQVIQTHGTETQKKTIQLKLVGLSDYYLVTQNGSAKKMIYLLSGIAGFILLLAVINFVNLSIASASARMKEIGVRKVIGGVRRQLVFQFLSESLIITLFAGVASLLTYELLRTRFGELLAITFPALWTLTGAFWMGFVVCVFAIGIVAGLYPAVFLASYRTLDSLKGKLKETKSSFSFSRVLVTTQFIVAVFVCSCSVVITRQVAYFLEKDLGYDKSLVLTVSSVPRIWSQEGLNRMAAAKKEFLASSRIQSVSLSWEVPNGNNGGDDEFYRAGTSDTEAVRLTRLMTDESFAEVYQLNVTEGKYFFSPGEVWRPLTVVINEEASRILKVRTGDKLKLKGFDQFDFEIAGIINDFHFSSLRDPIKPMIIYHVNQPERYRFFSFKLQPGSLSASIDDVQAIWKKVFPDDPFDYQLMDERIASLYQSEQRLKKASAIATGIMILIVLVGILGLVTLTISRRTKEIGIRKVLGASVASVLALFAREYIRMILLASLLAVPVAFYAIHRWLNGFAYRVELQWWMFALPGAGLLVIALMVILIQSRRAALANPVNSLRSE